MTCIVGLVHKGSVFIGGDSAGVYEGTLGICARSDVKVFRNGEFLMGFCGSFRMGQLLWHTLKPPKRAPRQAIDNFMVNDFINAVRKCLLKAGHARKKDEVETAKDGAFLVGYQGRLFGVEEDYQVGENQCGYHAIGCGEHIALGSLYSTVGMEPERRARMALEAAAEFSAGVRGPFLIKELRGRP